MGHEKGTLTQRSDTLDASDDDPSTGLLQPDHDADGEASEDDDGTILSLTMARTIRDLERLVEEAVKLAESAGVDPNDLTETLPETRHPLLSRRPTLGLAKKISQYLEQVSSKNNDSTSSENADSPKSRSSARNTPPPQNEEEIEEAPRRCRGACSADNLRILPPEPVAEPLQEKKTKLVRRKSSLAAGPSRTQAANRFLSPPPIGSRTTSARRKSEARMVTPMSMPAIQVNGDERKVHFEEDKEPLLSTPEPGHERHFSAMFGIPSRHVSMNMAHPAAQPTYKIDLNGTRHVDVAENPDDLSAHSTCNHAPVARNWPTSRKRFAAWICCINTACLGILIGIYAGETPAIQYVIVDLNRQIILGNVFMYIGLAVSTLIFWPLPLLHGRKPYTLAALLLALCLQVPQGVMVLAFRNPDVTRYRIILLLSRGASGFMLGFANINNFATLLDVFGASLQSDESHEVGNPFDVRRHGGGMGSWLAIWSSCTVSSISVGFLIGAIIIGGASVDWGFWISSLLLILVTLVNLLVPEPRRSAFRRTIAEVTGEGGSFSRVCSWRDQISSHRERAVLVGRGDSGRHSFELADGQATRLSDAFHLWSLGVCSMHTRSHGKLSSALGLPD